ncbi:MAG: hypothetical protein E7100_04970 [Bacteroidaceae bacterium]|jgi:hypothetical protein|nr:hypothetical protein [Bacteroidaceae bacterium]
MKYTSILAGFFGLMALAACTNNDEVVVEQPKGLHTITVALNKSADTRVQLSEFSVEEGFKGTWENDDKIGLIDEVGTRYTYTIDEIKDGGTVATFVLEGEDLPADGAYKVVYPYDWDGNLSDFANQEDVEYSVYDAEVGDQVVKFNANDYLYALGTATCKDGVFTGQVTLTPIFNFIYIEWEYGFYAMDQWGFEEYLDNEVWRAAVYLTGDNLYNKIEDFEGTTGTITLNNFSLWSDGNRWESNTHLMFAFPVLPGQEPVTDLRLDFDGVKCKVLNSDDTPASFSEGGHVYIMQEGNLKFPVLK